MFAFDSGFSVEGAIDEYADETRHGEVRLGNCGRR